MTGNYRVIGVDESGKGDFFGPLVIAAFLASDNDREKLAAHGVKDGKKISDNRLIEIDERIRFSYPHCIVVIDPETYNRRYKKIKNLNKLLADGHAEAITGVLIENKADRIIVDQFGKPELIENALHLKGCKIELQQRFRGEEIIQVAAASILARAAFIREVNKLSEKYKSNIPRGASSLVDKAGQQLVDKFGIGILEKVSKIHFKNYSRVVNPSLFSI